MLTKKITGILISLFVIALSAGRVQALPLDGDPAAVTSGAQQFSQTENGFEINAEVQYAVYHSADYGGFDPAWGEDEYIYAYQIFNSDESDFGINFFSVGILPGATVGSIGEDGSYGVPGGIGSVVQSFAANPVQSANFLYIPEVIQPTEHSLVLLFTSDLAPTIGFGTIAGGGISGSVALPTPYTIPEPATITLFALAGGMLIRSKRG